MIIILRSLALLVFIAAAVQIYGVGGRITEALWQWYKFHGYSNDGHITISYFALGITAGMSVVFLAIGFLVARFSHERFVSKSAFVSSVMLTAGLIGLSALVVSPLATMVYR